MYRRSFLRSALVLAPLVAVDPQALIWKPEKQAEKEIAAFVRDLRKTFRKMFHDDDLARLEWLGTTVSAATVTTDTVVLDQALRQPNSYVSGAFTIPASVSFFRLFANIGLADKIAVGLQCGLEVFRSSNGVDWQDRGGFGWTSYGPDGYHGIDKNGNPYDNPDPSFGYHVDPSDTGQQFQLRLTLPQPLTLGASVEITTG